MALTMFPVNLKASKSGGYKKVPSVKDWQNYKGDAFTSSLVGVVIPSNVVLIDLDLHKGVTKQAVEKALGCTLDWDNAFLQKTISGGEHYAFQHPDADNIRQNDSLCGLDGFDTRCPGRGWMCTGKGYEGEPFEKLKNISLLPILPSAAFEKLSSVTSLSKPDLDTMSLDEMIDLEPVDWSKEQVESAVMSMPVNENYGEWLHVGMALHHQSKGLRWGVKLWDKYSQQCDNYDRSEIISKWHSFKNNAGGITFKTLIHKYNLVKKTKKEINKDIFSNITTIDLDLLNKKPEQRRLIAGRFPVGCTSAVVAMGGVGKTTWLVRQAVLMAADGQKTLFVSSEDGPDDYQSKIYNAVRAFDLSLDLNDIAEHLHVMDLRGCGTKLVVEDGGSFVPSEVVVEITKAAQHLGVDMVVFETLSRFAGGEENERFEATVSACDAIATKFGGAVVLVHHTGKSQAREKVIDLYSGRGGSVLGDNTRSMTVLTKLDDDYQGDEMVIFDQVDLDAGRVFEVNHVRCSYASTVPCEYFVTRPGECNGPVLEPLEIGTEEEIRARALARANDRDVKIMHSIISAINEQGGQVWRKFFDTNTREKIGCTQSQGREVIDQMLHNNMLSIVEMRQENGQKKLILKVCDTPSTHLHTPCV